MHLQHGVNHVKARHTAFHRLVARQQSPWTADLMGMTVLHI